MAKKAGGAVPQFGGKVGNAVQNLNQKAMNFGQQTAQGTLGNTAGQLAGAATRSANFGNQTANQMNDYANRWGQQGAQQSAALGRQANLGPGGAVWGRQTPDPMSSMSGIDYSKSAASQGQFGGPQLSEMQSSNGFGGGIDYGQAARAAQMSQGASMSPRFGGGKSSAPPPNYSQMANQQAAFGTPSQGGNMSGWAQGVANASKGNKAPLNVPGMPQQQVNPQALSSQMRGGPSQMVR